MVNAELAPGGELSCEGRIVGRLQGFRFTPEAIGAEPVGIDNAEVADAIARELEVRANRLNEAVDGALVLANDGAIRWLGDPIAKIANGDALLAPRALILADDNLSEAARQKTQARVDLWLAAYVKRLLGPLFDLEAAAGLEGASRNVALQLSQALGVLERGRVAQDVKSLDQNARGLLRKLGVRFGAYYIYLPNLVKPAIRVLATQLWALRQAGSGIAAGLDEIPQLAASGRTSFVADPAIPRETYRVAGFRLCGDRAVRVDILERLADLIRPAVAYRPGVSAGAPPPGAADGDGFVVTGAMTSLTGCSGESFASVLRSLGFVSRQVKGPALTVVPSPPEAAQPANNPPDSADAAPVAETREDVAVSAEATTAGEDQIAPQPGDGEANSAPGSPAVAAPAAPESEISTPDGAPTASEALAPEGAVATSEATAEEGAVAVATTTAEDILIEVWSPRPPARQRAPRREARERAPTRPELAPEGETQPGRRGETAGRAAGRRRPHFSEPPPASAEAPPPKQEVRGFRGGRGDRRRFDKSGNGEVPQGRRGGPHKGGSPEERRPESPAAPAPRREPPINLDSPFAKLLALKTQLEAKGKGG
jgi:ATP-dependent RNA helicase SUPV3L1/SUV3